MNGNRTQAGFRLCILISLFKTVYLYIFFLIYTNLNSFIPLVWVILIWQPSHTTFYWEKSHYSDWAVIVLISAQWEVVLPCRVIKQKSIYFQSLLNITFSFTSESCLKCAACILKLKREQKIYFLQTGQI